MSSPVGSALAAVVLAWPRPGALILVGVLNFAVLTLIAFRWQMPLTHAAALSCLAVGYLTACHLVVGHLSDVPPDRLAANIVVLGDVNDFEFSETTSILEGAVLTSLMRFPPAEERYSYVFEGNSQTLDQILLSNEGLLQGNEHPVFDVVHLNSEFADAIQASDHEPSVVRMKFPGSADNPADEGGTEK